MRRLRRAAVALAASLATAVAFASAASAAITSESEWFTASDGVALRATVSGEAPLEPRPTIVEFSPYGRDSATFDGGPAYNHVLVQVRGTGDSDGRFDAFGPRMQRDVAEFLDWACERPWSDGRLGVNGFSASAIAIYNSLHQPFPCVRTAVLKSGTFELYRDLIYPGGINNLIPSAGVLTLIGAPALAQSLDRLARNPASGLDVLTGVLGTGLDGLAHSLLDGWWQERGFRGDANDLPTLIVNGFYDVESRGAFEGYRELRDDGARMVVIGAHEGTPAGTDGGHGEILAWFDRHLRGIENGAESEPRVKLWLSDGDRERMLRGEFVRYDAGDWPVPGTSWEPLALDPARSGSAGSLNDGSLTLGQASGFARQPYPALPSLPTATDPPNAGIAGGLGLNALTAALPLLTDMRVAEPLGLSYTTRPLAEDVLAAGPASLELRLASTAPQTNIWAVISDVHPDGSAHAVAAGRLNSDFPRIEESKSLTDPASGEIVQPYGVYDGRSQAPIGGERTYKVELWPIGNRFRAGHRIRLHVLGASAASLPSVPAINTVAAGGKNGSRLLFPILPGSDLVTALGAD